MGFYDLNKQERELLTASIYQQVENALSGGNTAHLLPLFNDEDTYNRKAAYTAVGKLYKGNSGLKTSVVQLLLNNYLVSPDYKVRQTIVNAAGEIGKADFEAVAFVFDQCLFDKHHAVRNAVIGSIKKMAEVNPKPVLSWARGYLHHPEGEVRREICHGIELRGRKFPADILPMLQELEFDKSRRVRTTLVHVLGQIAYKKGCLETVISHLNEWTNKSLVAEVGNEIVAVHHRYKQFAFLKPEAAAAYINLHLGYPAEGDG